MDILVVDILLWEVPLGETQMDVGDEVVDAVVDPRVGMLVVLDHPNTPHKGNKQEATILKALWDALNVDNWIIPKPDAHVYVWGMLDRGISSLEVVDSTLDHNVVLGQQGQKIENKIEMYDLGQLMSI